MKVEQLYTACLAHGAYYVESKGEVAIIDPLREIQPYLDMAAKRNARIKYIFETHFHADFVSGHVDLAKATGAAVVYGPTEMKIGFDALIGHDGQVFQIGDVTLTLLHTPGHTMESSCFLLKDEAGKEKALFTGDTLFIGDVGRPDLAQHVIADLTQEKLAAHLYDSLRNKIMPLPDDILIYPAHGAGSACGKNLSKETVDTLGNQKRTNFNLSESLSKEEFISELLTGLTPPPGYFPKNVLMNINGYASIDDVMTQGLKALSVEEFSAVQKEIKVLVIDTRKADDFGNGFIPGSINIGIDGSFAVWVGTLVKDIEQPILFIADPGREGEVVTRLARVGYDQALGFLKGGIDAWKQAGNPLEEIKSIAPDALALLQEHDSALKIIDVRKKSEYDAEHLITAINAPLDYIDSSAAMLNKQQTYYVHCAGGYRSMIFASMLRQRGYNNIVNVSGGFSAIKHSGKMDVTAYVCPTTLL